MDRTDPEDCPPQLKPDSQPEQKPTRRFRKRIIPATFCLALGLPMAATWPWMIFDKIVRELSGTEPVRTDVLFWLVTLADSLMGLLGSLLLIATGIALHQGQWRRAIVLGTAIIWLMIIGGWNDSR